jgi:hypothetical protein
MSLTVAVSTYNTIVVNTNLKTRLSKEGGFFILNFKNKIIQLYWNLKVEFFLF